MFENLTEKLSKTSEIFAELASCPRTILGCFSRFRKALLSADVHFRVVREFIDEVKMPAWTKFLKSVSPATKL